jgi:hypothetical protein
VAAEAKLNNGCAQCGMANVGDEYHPYVLCLLVEARGGDTVKARRDLASVLRAGQSTEHWLQGRVATFLKAVPK